MSTLVQVIIVLTFLSVIAAALATVSLTTIKEFERGVVLTLGRFAGIRQPGLRFVLPVIQQLERVDIRDQVFDVLPQNILTKDNVKVRVNAVVNYKVHDVRMAILDVADFVTSTREMAQAVLRNAVQGEDLDNLADQNRLASDIAAVLDIKTRTWGVKVTSLDIKELEVDPTMIRAIAQQAEAERRKRAKIIESEGELESAQNLREAAKILKEVPGAMQLRYLEALTSIGNERTSTIVFPFPTDLKDMLGGHGLDKTEGLKALAESPAGQQLIASAVAANGSAESA